MPRQLSLIGIAALAALTLAAGCASTAKTSAGGAGVDASAQPSAQQNGSAQPVTSEPAGAPTAPSSSGSTAGSSLSTPTASGQPTPTPTAWPPGVLASSIPPTVWALATGPPPAVGTHAVASIDGASVACPDGAPFVQPKSGPVSVASLPADAQIAAVVRCENVVRSYPGLGQWNVQLAEVADSGLSPFLAALRSGSTTRPPDVMCPMYLRLVPWFALVETSGAVLNPSWPTDDCGHVSESAITALDQLDFQVVDAVRVAQAS
jgi:hypothetical protein